MTDKSTRHKRKALDTTDFGISEYLRFGPNRREKLSKRILSVSYDPSLLATRRMLLEQRGYEVASAFGFSKAAEQCQQANFDLFILGHSIPDSDKLSLIKMFRENCSAPILSLERHGEDFVPCDFHASPDDPEKFLQVVDGILDGRPRDPSADF